GGRLMISNALRRVELGDVPVSTPTGRLVGASGLLLEASGCTLRTGQRCLIEQRLEGASEGSPDGWLAAQVVGFRDQVAYLMPFKKPDGLAAGARVLPAPERSSLMIGPQWLGRIVNG